MDGSGRTGMSRRVRLQAAALAIVLAADGVIAYLLGAPAWLAVLYIALGLGVAALRLWFGDPKAEHAPAAASASERAPAPVVDAELPPEAVNRAIGYVCVPSVSNGELRQAERGGHGVLREPRPEPGVSRARR